MEKITSSALVTPLGSQLPDRADNEPTIFDHLYQLQTLGRIETDLRNTFAVLLND
jgi:hypothetical protein